MSERRAKRRATAQPSNNSIVNGGLQLQITLLNYLAHIKKNASYEPKYTGAWK
jgi:hypothetical protein